MQAFEPKWALLARTIVDFKSGSLFRAWTVAVIIDNKRKKEELEEVMTNEISVQFW